MYLADKSATARFITAPAVADRLGPLIDGGLVATCGVIDLEVLYSARNVDDYDAMQSARSGLPRLTVTEDHLGQALALQRALSVKGQHRLPIADLLIASVALLHNATVLHYDHDFDVIGEVCELRHEWVVPRGSL